MNTSRPLSTARMTATTTTNVATNSSANRQQLPQNKMLKKRRQLSGYESSSPEDNTEDEEMDETFVALQKLLKALNNNSSRQAVQVAPIGTTAPTNDNSSTSSTRAAAIARSSHTVATPVADMPAPNDQQRLSQEEILASRRQERERFRHRLFSKGTRRRRPVNHYLQLEEEEEEEEPVLSVESAISNRVINGSFSRLNVHVISRDRWSREEVERLPIVLLPEGGKLVSPAENPKLNVCHTNEHMDLHDQLMAHLSEMPETADHSRLLTPPQSTWYIQMRGMDAIHC